MKVFSNRDRLLLLAIIVLLFWQILLIVKHAKKIYVSCYLEIFIKFESFSVEELSLGNIFYQMIRNKSFIIWRRLLNKIRWSF